MFNANSTPSHLRDKTYIPVILTLADGENLKGVIEVARNSRLGDLLNGPDKYILFKTNSGEPIYLALSTIAAVQSNEKPSARQLDKSLKQMEDVNPYKILKVEPGVDKEGLRDAYHQLVKNYHPDQFANTSLPKEVQTYLETVTLRLNAAYQELLNEVNRLERAKLVQAAATTSKETADIRYFGQ